MKTRKRYWQIDDLPLLIIEEKVGKKWATHFNVEDLKILLRLLKHKVTIKKVDMK